KGILRRANVLREERDRNVASPCEPSQWGTPWCGQDTNIGSDIGELTTGSVRYRGELWAAGQHQRVFYPAILIKLRPRLTCASAAAAAAAGCRTSIVPVRRAARATDYCFLCLAPGARFFASPG